MNTKLVSGTAAVLAVGSLATSLYLYSVSSRPPFIWSPDGSCYYVFKSQGDLECLVIDAYPYPGSNGLCFDPFVDKKCN